MTNAEPNAKEKDLKKVKKLVPDTSIIIEGIISKEIEKGALDPKKVLIHEAVVSELENQANKGREVGILGLKEIKRLNVLSGEKGFELAFSGKRPGEFEIKYAKSGEIDSIIRALAAEEEATLFTADRVQSYVAESKDIDVILYEFEEEERDIPLEKFFDEHTMSIHLKEGTVPKAKKGEPGGWEYVAIRDEAMGKDEIEDIANELVEQAHMKEDSFVEINRKGSTIVQIENYRTVITRPPFADDYEITAVRPVAHLSLDDYDLSEKLKERLSEKAEGILISGAPGHGKSTFARALAEFYLDKNKVVKTIEAPRDLVLPDEITQYAMSHGSTKEIHDILLLSRPDYTVFDEMRNTSDFNLFSDLRLSGVGMVGVVHATQTIDAVQRFLGRVELGVIPHIIDTVLFIREGGVGEIYALKMEVKVPAGMTEADLARPVVVVSDFETGNPEFEIYSYGEQTVVIPVTEQASSPMTKLAEESIRNVFENYTDVIDVEMQGGSKATVYVPHGAKRKIIGKGGENIDRIEKELGLGIDVRETTYDHHFSGDSVEYDYSITKKNVIFTLEDSLANEDLDIYVEGEFLTTTTVSKKGEIKMAKGNELGKFLVEALNAGQTVELRG